MFQTVITHLHTLSIQIHSYPDDSLIKDFDQQTLVSQTEMVIQLFLNLFYFLISWKKSELTPSQNFLFLGEHYKNGPRSHFSSRGKICLPLSERVSSSCSTSATRRVILVTNPVISHERGKNREVLTTNGAYPWSFVTQISHSDQPSHGGDRNPFAVMT